VRRAGPEDADTVLAVTRAAFAEQAHLGLEEPETNDDVRGVLAEYAAWLAVDDNGQAVGALRARVHYDRWYIRKAAVLPICRGRGIGTELVTVAEKALGQDGVTELWAGVWKALPENIAYWERRGFVVARDNGGWVALRKLLPVTIDVPTAGDMHALGRRLATVLRAGDVVVLSGALGAGKTTLTQGIGDGLEVRGPVTSPTFVIARLHPSLRGGAPLVHVDAYRLSSLGEIEDLDLDASVEEAVTVVEWGAGLVDTLTESRLHVELVRAEQDEGRTVRVQPVGSRWQDAAVAAVVRAAI
jgi:tRNA threonylcarbamoyladenosine biosynthesis protein TsaE